jgi:predicted RNA-binding protein with PUA-like domain
MSYWLLKTEPSCYSFDDLERDKKTIWDGVSNNLALKYLRQIKKGDQAFIYHTGDVKAVIGIAEITSGPYADPKQKDEKLAVIDLKPIKRLKKPISLAYIKAQAEFSDFLLVKMSRLSVMPVSKEQWQLISKLA